MNILEKLQAAFPNATEVGIEKDLPKYRLSLAATENVNRAGGCSHPLRMTGSISVTADGRVINNWSTDKLPGQALYVACKSRRTTRCPSCAKIYQGDAYQLIIAGLRGGKNMPESVAKHPALFVTLTAPGFGQVHSHRKDPRDRSKIIRCRPRRNGEICAHGRPLVCWQRHDKDDASVGQPFCSQCFDYKGAVLWNNAASALWRVTRTNIDRKVAKALDVPIKNAKDHFKTQYIKVAEMQTRGLVHFHVTIRLDGPTIDDDAPLTTQQFADAIKEAVTASSVNSAIDEPVTWGVQGFDVRPIGEDGQSRKDAAFYSAKYSTKSSDGNGVLDRRFLRLDEARVNALPINKHLKRLVWTSWRLGVIAPELKCDAWAHQFGFRGHFMTKSRGWSTTFKALRNARADKQAEARIASWQAVKPGSPIAIKSKWEFEGVGYRSTREAEFAGLIRKHKTEAVKPAA